MVELESELPAVEPHEAPINPIISAIVDILARIILMTISVQNLPDAKPDLKVFPSSVLLPPIDVGLTGKSGPFQVSYPASSLELA